MLNPRSLLLITLVALGTPSFAQTISAPAVVSGGGPVPVVVTGLVPGQRVTLVAQRVTSDVGPPTGFRSEATYNADARGVIDLAAQAPVAGDYTGVDASGLFWSMRPIKRLPANVAPGEARITVELADRPIASTVTRFQLGNPNVVAEPISAFSGAMLYRLPGTQRLPVIIALGGSEGGSSFGREFGPWLAEQGYAVVALPYYVPDWSTEKLGGLPVDFADIPVDRLEQVHRWIKTRRDLDARRIGLYGVSKGGEFSMIAASRFAWLKAVAAIVPSDVVWEGWGPNVKADDTHSSFSWRGRPLSYVPYKGMRETIAALYRGEKKVFRIPHEDGRAANPDRVAAARIPIERYRGALLVAGGEADQTWPSGSMVRNIGETRASRGMQTVVLTFADAGHGLSGSGWEPQNYPGVESSAAATAHAQVIVRSAVLRLFGKALK